MAAIPQWASSALDLGFEMASHSNVDSGQSFPTVFLSVPTGQYIAPLLMAGAFLASPKIADPRASVGETFRAVAYDGNSQICDMDVTLSNEIFQGSPQLMYRSDGYLRKTNHPVLRIENGVPDDRSRRVLAVRDWDQIRQMFKRLPKDTATSAEKWWTSHCLSPAVIVGQSLEFVDKQRQVLLERASDWIDPRVLPVVEYSKPGAMNRDRILHHPYTFLTIDATKSSPWLCSVKPRLVIYTSWWAYYRRKTSAFSGVPTVVVVNRRVSEADIAASLNTFHDPSIQVKAEVNFPSSFGLRAEWCRAVPVEVADDASEVRDDDADGEPGDF
jgi:hypothetical protein